MLRLIPKLLAALVAVALLVVGALAVALPRLVNGEEFRAALRANAEELLGTPVGWRHLDVGIVPLRLTLEEPVLDANIADPEDARLSAASIDLRLSAAALFRRKVEVESLVFKGVELVVTRTPEGLVLPLAPSNPSTRSPASEGASEAPPSQDDGGELGLALRRLVVEEARIVIRDRTLSRPLDWELTGFSLEATGEDLEQPLSIDLESGVNANGAEAGSLAIQGDVTLAGLFDLAVELDAVALEKLQPYVSDATVGGFASGRIEVDGALGVVSSFATNLRVEGMDITTFGLDLQGRLDLVASQTLDRPIAFDATVDLGERGRADLGGNLFLEGALDSVIVLDELDLVPFAALAGDEMAIAGRASGRVDLVVGETGRIEKLATDLRIPDARYTDTMLDLKGDLDLVLGFDGLGPADPFRFDVAVALAEDGGRVDAEGTATFDGAIDAKLVLGNVDVAPLAPWVPKGTRIAGRLTGDVDLARTAGGQIERIATRLTLAGARIVRDPVDVAGRFDLTLGIEGEGPIDLSGALALDDGSVIRLEGTSTNTGVVDVHANFESFDLAIVRPFIPNSSLRLEGLATGKGRLVGDVAAPEFLSFELGVEQGAIEAGDASLDGPFLVSLEIKEPLSRPRGRAKLDLTATTLRYGASFAKPENVRAEGIARFVPEKTGEIVFEADVAFRDVDEILVQGAIADSTTIAVTTTDIDLEGWQEILPVIGPWSTRGKVALDGLAVELVGGEPRQFGGRIAIRGVALTIPDAGRVQLRGTIVAEQTRVRTKGLKAKLGPAVIAIKGAIDDPLGEGRFDLAIQTAGDVEANEVLSNLTSARDTVYGPLRLTGQVTGHLDDPAGVTSTLAGGVRFSVGESGGGRLRGVSLLRTILDQIPLVGVAARLSRPFRGGRSVGDFFTERFEIIEGVFEIGEGRVEAETLRLAYPGYEARLTGPVRLADLSIDMTGEMLLKSDLVSTLGGLAGAEVPGRDPIRIELAKVTNTLAEPEVEMTPETLAAIPKLLFQGIGLDTITKGIGKGVGQALDRVLGGN
ncbi:MAG: hypothetical protein CL931_10690 [Deltaproteobacteria bacterium]|nr:hypothetical protein [Deltaproteobacteria bacterium]